MLKDLTGMQFGRLTVIDRASNTKDGSARWNCVCSCGTKKTIMGSSLLRGATVSCGCYQKEMIIRKQTTHGQTHTRLFHVWQHMRNRCYNENYKFYNYYGGRGISVCDEWRDDFVPFMNWAKSNGYSDDLTLDRIDTNGNYEPSNCRWISRADQMNNTRLTKKYTMTGETHSIAEWCRIYNVPHERTRHRLVVRGWSIEDALTVPPLKKNHEPR